MNVFVESQFRRTARVLLLISACQIVFSSSDTVFAQAVFPSYSSVFRYDAMNRIVGIISSDPDGNGPLAYGAVRNTYDEGGRLTKVERGELSSWQAVSTESISPSAWSGFTVFNSTETVWDVQDRKVSELIRANSSGPISSFTQFRYDAVGRLQCTAVRMNPSVYGSLSSDACTLGAQGVAGPDRITRNIYDAAGQLVQVIKAYGVTTANGFAETLQTVEATYAYSANGKQTDVIDANGNHAQLGYDGFDRQTRWTFPSTGRPSGFDASTQASALATAGSVNGGDYEAYGYDANSNRTSFRKREGSTLIYNYDALNRATSKIVPGRGDLPGTDSRSVFYTYDLQNHQIAARFDSSGGEGVSNAFDGLGRQTSSSLTMDGVTRTVSFFYDADGNRTRMTYPDGNYVTYAYDGLDRPSLILRSGTASTPIASYTYDAAGRRTGFNGGVSTSYGYDGIGRLTSLTNAPNANGSYTNTYGFGYNPASQITSLSKSNNSFVFNGAYNVNRGYSVNGLNQYTGAGTASFAYDANGNLTGDTSTTFLYDVENRLVAAGGRKQAQLRYDPLGRLYEVASPTGTTRFFYNGDELIGEYDTSGNLLRRYAHGADLKSDDPIAWYEGAGFDNPYERFLRSDWQGSIALVTDNAGSSIYATNTFDEYGIPGANNAGRFQYTGQAWMPELGMYYYKARFYSPTLGRFMQTDPIGYKDQVNLYAYVANDPVDGVDYTGLSCMRASGNGAGAETYNCHLDDPGDLSEKDLQKVNKAYTGAVNKLMEHQDRRVDVTIGDGNGGELHGSTTQGEIGNSLIRSEAMFRHGKNYAESLFGKVTLNDLGARQDARGIMKTFIHEGMHDTLMDSNFQRKFDANSSFWEILTGGSLKKFNQAHQESSPGGGYNRAAYRILDN